MILDKSSPQSCHTCQEFCHQPQLILSNSYAFPYSGQNWCLLPSSLSCHFSPLQPRASLRLNHIHTYQLGPLRGDWPYPSLSASPVGSDNIRLHMKATVIPWAFKQHNLIFYLTYCNIRIKCTFQRRVHLMSNLNSTWNVNVLLEGSISYFSRHEPPHTTILNAINLLFHFDVDSRQPEQSGSVHSVQRLAPGHEQKSRNWNSFQWLHFSFRFQHHGGGWRHEQKYVGDKNVLKKEVKEKKKGKKSALTSPPFQRHVIKSGIFRATNFSHIATTGFKIVRSFQKIKQNREQNSMSVLIYFFLTQVTIILITKDFPPQPRKLNRSFLHIIFHPLKHRQDHCCERKLCSHTNFYIYF